MQVKASINNLNMSPKKIRLVAGLVKGMKVQAALDQLRFLNKRAAKPGIDLINAAIANATHNFKLDRNNLFIKEMTSGKAMTLKRFTPKAHGRATEIRKVRAHVYLTLEEIVPSKEHEGVKPKSGKSTKVDSREQIKENVSIKDRVEKGSGVESSEEKVQRINDPRMEGKHRHVPNEQLNKKSPAGTKKTLFHRKAS